MKAMKKSIAVFLILTGLSFLLTSCDGKTLMDGADDPVSEEASEPPADTENDSEPEFSEENSETEERTSAQEAPEESTAQSAQTTQAGQTTQPGQTTQTEQKTTQTAQATQAASKTPQTKQECLTAYNNALSKKTLTCTSSSQKITSGKFWLGDNENTNINLLDSEHAVLLQQFQNTNLSGVKLQKLTESEVSSVKISGKTVTFSLSGVSADSSISQGRGGYLALVDDARIDELIENIKAYIKVSGNVKISSITHRLSGGTMAVTFNSDFSEIQSVKYSANQAIQAKLKYLILTINTNLSYQLSAEFQ